MRWCGWTSKSKATWDRVKAMVLPLFTKLGADGASLTAVRLTRLPGCRRGSRMQQLSTLIRGLSLRTRRSGMEVRSVADAPEPPQDPKLDELAESLRAAYEAAGVPLPDKAARTAATVFVGAEKSRPPVQQVVSRVAELIVSKELYRRGQEIGTINPGSGDWELMTPHRFVTWLPRTAGIFPVREWQVDRERPARSRWRGSSPSTLRASCWRVMICG